MRRVIVSGIALIAAALLVCFDSAVASPLFIAGEPLGLVSNPAINEASGLATGRRSHGVLWTHNDSGGGPIVYAVSPTGATLGTFTLSGTAAVDWEDMAIAPDPVSGQPNLYIGDVGDNRRIRPTIQVHRVAEPLVSSAGPPVTQTLTGVETFTFNYPDGARDVESLIVDPLSGDMIFVTKRDASPRVYRAAYPQSSSAITTLEFIGELAWPETTDNDDRPSAADISADGSEVLIRSRTAAYYWSIPEASSIVDTLVGVPGIEIPLADEPQGEAIAFDAVGRNYFTLSEDPNQPIYVYARIPEPASVLPTLVGLLGVVLRRRRPAGSLTA